MRKPMSPMRVTMNAFLPAAAASGLWNQKLMSKYDATPTISQHMNSSNRLLANTRPSIPAANSDR